MEYLGYSLIVIIAMVVGYFIINWGKCKFDEYKVLKAPLNEPEPIPEILDNHKRPPDYHGYSGGFVKVNYCSNCGNTGWSLHLSIHNPCPDCGGGVSHWGSAKWVLVQGKWQWVKSKII